MAAPQTPVETQPAATAPPAPRDAPRSPRPPLWALRLGARADLPGIGRLLGRAGVWDQPRWTGAPHRETRGLWHGCRMRLDLSDYHQRGAYFYGRLLDLSVQAFITAALAPGDDCIDFGANIGLVTMAAARAVGPRGRVLAVEPNPQVFARLRWHVKANRLDGVRMVCAAASDREAIMVLSVPPTGNTGAGSLGGLPPRHGGKTSATYDVPVHRSDDLVEQAWGPPDAPAHSFLLVKVDVEGHETALLRGLHATIQRRRPAILAEVNPYMLTTNGSSADELMQLLRGWGYRPFEVGARRRGLLRRPRVRLTPLPPARGSDRISNVVFLSDLDNLPARITRMISRTG